MAILSAQELCYSYKTKYQTVQAVKDVTCDWEAGVFYALVGKSGSGKTTLLSLLAGLEKPQSGCVLVDSRDLRELDVDLYRRSRASVIYQSYNLFPLMTVRENVMYPLKLAGVSDADARTRAQDALARVGLNEDYWKRLPAMLSGGEQQRVAIARALAKRPQLLLCDEPTGALDYNTGKQILALLQEQSRQNGMTVVIITHNSALTAMADRVIHIKNGTVQSMERNERPTPVEEIEW